MSYQVLARKWRPKNFSQVIGQSHVCNALSNALTQGRLHHAYLFTGTRGVGKTTLARIIAKCLNCESKITATPCEQCHSCQAIDKGHAIDLIEVDGASRTKVEDTRDLLDNVQYAPTNSRFKIYLIDEVHMLSGHSFNALLKTLEEPPEHVKFLLATTDPQKLPITVLSRCLQFNLKHITVELLVEQLQTILNAENIAYEEKTLSLLAIAANGSVRDALSLLDQAIGFSQNNIKTADIQQMLGHIDNNHIIALLNALANSDNEQVFAITQQISEVTADFNQVLEQLLSCLHRIAINQVLPEITPDHEWRAEDIKPLATNINKETLQLYYQIALIGKRDLPLAPSGRIGFEMVLLRMLAFEPATATRTAIPSTSAAPQTTPSTNAKPTTTVSSSSSQNSPLATFSNTTDNNKWVEIISALPLNPLQKTIAENCILQSLDNEQALLLIEPSQTAFVNKDTISLFSKLFSDHFKRPIKVSIETGSSTQVTPAKTRRMQDQQKMADARVQIEEDPLFQEIKSQFNGAVENDSIIPIE